jgi:hypothetical protein
MTATPPSAFPVWCEGKNDVRSDVKDGSPTEANAPSAHANREIKKKK